MGLSISIRWLYTGTWFNANSVTGVGFASQIWVWIKQRNWFNESRIG